MPRSPNCQKRTTRRRTKREIEEIEKRKRLDEISEARWKFKKEYIKTQGFRDLSKDRREKMKNALKEWTSLPELLHIIVVPYVKDVRLKIEYRGFTSKREVYDDICNFKALHQKLIAERSTLPIAQNISEILLFYAMLKLAKMIRSFSTMLSDSNVPEDHKQWIQKQLEKGKLKGYYPEELLEIAKENLKHTLEFLKRFDKDIQSEVKKGTKEQLRRLKSFSHNVKDFHVENFVDKKNEFKIVKKQIAHEDKQQEELYRYGKAYAYTSQNVVISHEDLSIEFSRMRASVDEENLEMKLWEDLRLEYKKRLEDDEKKQKEIDYIGAAKLWWGSIQARSGLV